MINGNIEHLVGMDVIRRGVKGRVLVVRVGRDTFVDVVLESGAFEAWYLPLCVEAEPGALLRKVEASVEAAAEMRRMLREWTTSTSNGKSTASIMSALLCPGEPSPVVEPAAGPAVVSGETLLWFRDADAGDNTWHLGRATDDWSTAPWSAWDYLRVRAYRYGGASEDLTADVESHEEGCKIIAAWAREDGNIVPPHPVYGEV